MKARRWLHSLLMIEGALIVTLSLWPAAIGAGFVSSPGGGRLIFTLALGMGWPGVAMIATGIVAIISHPDTMNRTGLVIELSVAVLAAVYLTTSAREIFHPAILYETLLSSLMRLWIGVLLVFNLAHTLILHSSRLLKNTLTEIREQ
ncbi:MAG: hypothetical protein QUV02_13120 [Maricaulis sp.]|uniref:hypothetical protein n=1 Tax=Maricaulis sp. TaxID=1486257 RepID=UPI00261D6BB7|nr:hypothetical protein [Maricaulis sp.]MDM7985383.1 hypothetical protein [Maricaulis sp.]